LGRTGAPKGSVIHPTSGKTRSPNVSFGPLNVVG
jgi:hypothetical protein